jgi:hypothetical protein
MRQGLGWSVLVLAQFLLVFRDLYIWSIYPQSSSTKAPSQSFYSINDTAELLLLDSSQMKISVSPKKRLAIVIPFIEEQIDLLKFQLVCIWKKFPPCFYSSDAGQVDLILFFSGSVRDQGNPGLFPFLREANFESFSWRHCFGDIYLMNAQIPKEYDTHPEGTCVMFYKIFPTLENKYLYFQILEPDVTPFRQHVAWLKEILAMSQDHNDFWMKGSVR